MPLRTMRWPLSYDGATWVARPCLSIADFVRVCEGGQTRTGSAAPTQPMPTPPRAQGAMLAGDSGRTVVWILF